MSDESSRQTASADSSPDATESTGADGSSGSLEPGGGPQRVVSDQSVDDILDSLDATDTESPDAGENTANGEEPAVESDGSETNDAAPSASETADGRNEGNDGSIGTDDGPTDADGDVTTEFDEDEIPAADDSNATDESSIDGAASALADASNGDAPDEDASLEELAARIEDGTVTGADVRAAEAGEGRESTPDVDEIELSMDDLEETQSATTAASPGGGGTADVRDDAGPLAGTVGDDGTAGDGDNEDSDDSPGLLGRIKRFFGG